MSHSKNIQFKQYNRTSLNQILSSQFVYANPNEIPLLKRLVLIIQVRAVKKTHFWYLTLLTNQKPYIKKFHSSWKNRAQKNNLLRPKDKSACWNISIQKKNILPFFRMALFDLFSAQYRWQECILKLEAESIRIKIPSAPLTFKTSMLQAKNHYVGQIPLTFKFTWNSISLFQKIFLLRSWKVINQPHIKNLDAQWDQY